MSKRERASGHAQVYTYTFLFEAAHHSLNAGKRQGAPSAHFCLLSLVSSAFCLEAYLNELGERKLKLWSSSERISPRGKLKKVCAKLKFKPDRRVRPFKTFRWVFDFRNSVAHARTEVVSFDNVATRDDIDAPVRPLTRVEQACNLNTASAVLQDVREMVDALGENVGSRFSPLLVAAHSAWVVSVEE